MGFRSNRGNVTTNAMQVFSIGTTTATKVFRDRADSALNNLSKEEQSQYYKMKADQMRDEIKTYYGKKEEPKNEEQGIDDLIGDNAKSSSKTVESKNLNKDLIEDDIKIAPDTIEGKNVNKYSGFNLHYVEDRAEDRYNLTTHLKPM